MNVQLSLRRATSAVAMVCSMLPLVSAQAQEELPGVFGEILDVRVVNLEVVVTDKDGLRVSGLEPGDFRILVDKQPVSVDYFTEVVGGAAVAAQAAGDGPATAGLPSLTPGEPVGTSYLLFIDDFFSIPRDRDQVLDALREDLPLLGPGDRMAIVAFDGKRLDMVSTWSDSTPALERALKEAERRPAHGLQRVAEFRNFRADTSSLSSGRVLTTRAGNRLDIEEEYYARQLADQVGRSVEAAAATLRSFASPPGRKVMLLLSGGWPFQPTEYATADVGELIFDRYIDGGPDLFRTLTDTANRLGYTLYPVDVPGQQVEGTDPEDIGLTQDDSLIGDSSQIPATGLNFKREQELHTALGFIARETGGRPLINSTRLDSLPRVVEDTRSYYWLGFTPTWQGDDKIHDIKVEVTKPGLKVRSRESFQDLSRRTEVTNMVESALLFGNAPSANTLRVELGQAKRAGRGKVQVPMTVIVNTDQIAVLPYGDGYAAQLELRIAAVDQEGGRSPIPVIPLQLVSEQPLPPGQELRYTHEVTLRKGPQELIVAVYDPASGNLLSSLEKVRF
ncbi:MAG: VWA domain-containing protein [Acidobacteria bacterium]|nr:VWA domain-containing protein [Acidobacteriota bacterium]